MLRKNCENGCRTFQCVVSQNRHVSEYIKHFRLEFFSSLDAKYDNKHFGYAICLRKKTPLFRCQMYLAGQKPTNWGHCLYHYNVDGDISQDRQTHTQIHTSRGPTV